MKKLNTPEIFDEIRPYEEGEMRQAFEDLLSDRQFCRVLRSLVPWLPKSILRGFLRLVFCGVKTPLDFQKRFMKPVVKYIIKRYTDGLTVEASPCPPNRGGDLSGDQHAAQPSSAPPLFGGQGEALTFISNHRDIVLDSAFLDVLLVDLHYPTTVEIGIGDNLLIYPWIKRLVRMNKAFIVRRSLSMHEMMASSQLMSGYIHYAVTEKRENIWIAQREGRAKDSDDRTQESVLKMLAMGGDLEELNIVPLTISYEYDPCDYLKAREFQQKRDNPHFKKSKQDDLDNMRTGIFGYKGRVHYHWTGTINESIAELKARQLPKNEFYKALAELIDHEIHRGYRLYPNNYVALDLLNGDDAQAAHYTPEDKARFMQYLDGQIAKIDLPGKDEPFLRERILTMYANPLRNYQASIINKD